MFGTKLGSQHSLVYIVVLKWLESKTIVICLILRAKLLFYGFLSDFGTLSRKVVQTWFVGQNTSHTTLFGIYCYVEMVRIENNNHMFEITC